LLGVIDGWFEFIGCGEELLVFEFELKAGELQLAETRWKMEVEWGRNPFGGGRQKLQKFK
jgi:hypothetical protein